jgi:hypothetical protein
MVTEPTPREVVGPLPRSHCHCSLPIWLAELIEFAFGCDPSGRPIPPAGRVVPDHMEWSIPQVWPACQAENLGGSRAVGNPALPGRWQAGRDTRQTCVMGDGNALLIQWTVSDTFHSSRQEVETDHATPGAARCSSALRNPGPGRFFGVKDKFLLGMLIADCI